MENNCTCKYMNKTENITELCKELTKYMYL